MVADLLEMRENQWFSEIRIDKLRFVSLILSHTRYISRLAHRRGSAMDHEL